MPCIKCSNGKWRIGSGKCMYKTKESCEKALAAYYAGKKPKTFCEEAMEKYNENASNIRRW